MTPELTTIEPMTVVGLEVRTTNQDEMNPATARIAGLWGRFYQEGLMERIPGRMAGGGPLGVYSKYESDHTGPYSLLAGVEVSDAGRMPAGTTGVTVAGGRHLVFSARGPMPQSLIQTWMGIWEYFSNSSIHQRAYTTDFERHLGNDAVDIHIAVK